VVATTTESTDDELYDWCVKEGINVYRGSEGDVLNRVVNAAREFNIDIIVEITGDCILTDPNIVDQCVLKYLQSEADVVTNCGEQLTYPMGIYAQVFSTEELKWVDEKIDDAAVREHVSLYFYENPTRYKIVELICPSEYSQPAWRLQLDYTEDLKVLRLIYAGLEPQYGDNFGLPEICNFLRKRIEILLINQDCIEKSPR
jgi:spore coat polysaccharide biosynthesis protein SpsF